MLKLEAIRFDKVWGYELWLASTHPNGRQDALLEYAGGEWPLLVKVICAKERLSVQVHPDDDTARTLEGAGAVGKTECWYVLDADEGARIVCGLKSQAALGTRGDSHGRLPSAPEVEAAVREGSLERLLNEEAVRRDDFVFIPSGTVHAIGGGLRLLEVQQACDITYRLYDWGRPRELHVEKALRSIKHADAPKAAPFEGDFSCPYFSLEETRVSGAYSAYNPARRSDAGGLEVFFVLEGEGRVRGGSAGAGESQRSVEFGAEDAFALRGGEKITFMTEGARIMKISRGEE